MSATVLNMSVLPHNTRLALGQFMAKGRALRLILGLFFRPQTEFLCK